MKDNRDRCDHCRKWVLMGSTMMPNTSEEYQDGRFGICQKCATNKKYDRAYWEAWRIKKQKQEVIDDMFYGGI